MRIVVKSQDTANINIAVPSRLLLNRVSAAIGSSYLKRYGIDISQKQAIALVKELNRFRRKHRDWVLVEVQSKEGDYVKIKL